MHCCFHRENKNYPELTQLKFARGKGADSGRQGRIWADMGRVGRGEISPGSLCRNGHTRPRAKFSPGVGADLGPVGFDQCFGGVMPPFWGVL